MIGSKYDSALRNLLKEEFEFQLERSIETEKDFIRACEEYAGLEEMKERPVTMRNRNERRSCYLCHYPADNPVIIHEGDAQEFSQTSFHAECLKKAAVNYILDRKFKSLPILWGKSESAKLIKLFPE